MYIILQIGAVSKRFFFENRIDLVEYTSLNNIKSEIGFSEGEKLVLNGFNKRSAKYISDACLHFGNLYIRRLRWTRLDDSIEHIYLAPDFALPYFKFSLDDYEHFIKYESNNNYLEGIEDPQGVVDSDLEIERDLVRLNKKIEDLQVVGSINSRFTSLLGNVTISDEYLTVEGTKYAALWSVIKGGMYNTRNLRRIFSVYAFNVSKQVSCLCQQLCRYPMLQE
jgi:hypothetical protein